MSEPIDSIQICFVGDYCPSQGYTKDSALAGKDLIDWGNGRDYFKAANLVVVNLECPLTDHKEYLPKSGPHLSAHPGEAVLFSTKSEIAANLANNHILDVGEKGLLDTIKYCEKQGIKILGAGRNLDEASMPLILDYGDLSLGILAVAENEYSIAKTDRAGANPLDLVDNYHQIADLRKKVNFVLVLYHGGHEHYPLPSPRIKKTLRCFVDWGADAVLCHHSHTISGMEVYHNAPIFYGLGNFIFGSKRTRPAGWSNGILVNLQISKSGGIQHDVVPFTQSQGEKLVKIHEGEQKNTILSEFNKLSEIIASDDDLSQKWETFYNDKKKYYLASFFGFNRLERFLYKRFSLWPFWKVSSRRLKAARSYIHCEAHADVIVSALDLEISRREG